MVYIDIENCDREKYLELLRYIFRECNQVTFHFPNFTNTGCVDVRLTNDGETNAEYVEYLARNAMLIRSCLNSGGIKKTTKVYNGVKLAYNTQMIQANLSESIKVLLKRTHLYNWLYPDLPEDVCFFRNGLCRYLSESHEQIFIMCNEKKEDIDFLKNMGFSFRIKR